MAEIDTSNFVDRVVKFFVENEGNATQLNVTQCWEDARWKLVKVNVTSKSDKIFDVTFNGETIFTSTAMRARENRPV